MYYKAEEWFQSRVLLIEKTNDHYMEMYRYGWWTVEKGYLITTQKVQMCGVKKKRGEVSYESQWAFKQEPFNHRDQNYFACSTNAELNLKIAHHERCNHIHHFKL